MSSKVLKKKYGIVVLLDALGASAYSEKQIREFLSARREINGLFKEYTTKEFLAPMGDIGKFHEPEIFTFGDTVIITVPLRSNKYVSDHLWVFSMIMKRYLFHSMVNGILFRGSFSIGNYIADSDSNTVMGEAVSDAAAWYETSEWVGLSSTPKTNIAIEYHLSQSWRSGNTEYFRSGQFGWFDYVAVPQKGGKNIELYIINWARAFFDPDLLGDADYQDASQYYLKVMSGFSVPRGTELKYENTHKYFERVKKMEASKESVKEKGADLFIDK